MLVVHHTCTMIWSELTAGSTVLWHSPILHTDMGWKPIIYGIYWLKTHYCPLSFGGVDQTLDLHRLGQEFYHKAASDASHLLVLNMVSTSCSGWTMNLLCSPGCQWTWGPPTSVLLPCSWDYRHERVRPANSCFILQRGKPYIFEHWYFFHSPLASVLQEFLESRLCLPSLLSSAPRIDCSCQSRMVPWKQRLPQACLICSILCSELTYATPHISTKSSFSYVQLICPAPNHRSFVRMTH